MGKKQTLKRKEYVDSDGWKVLELVGPNFSTIFKTKDKQCIYISNGKLIHRGPYNPDLFQKLINSNLSLKMNSKTFDAFTNHLVEGWVDSIFSDGDVDENIILDLIEDKDHKDIGTTYKYAPPKKEPKIRDTGCGGCGCGCFIFVCLFMLACSAIGNWLVDIGHAIVQLITNFF